MQPATPLNHPWRLVALAVAALAAVGAGVWWLQIHHFSVGESIDAGIALLRDAGPWVFFTAMVLLPAVGFPIAVLYLAAGTAFGERMGIGWVLAATGLAVFANLALTYWLARFGLRPWLESLVSRTRYKIPVVVEAEQTEITLLVRITPGPPFFLQSYLLGLAGIRFRTYLVVSWLIAMVYATGFIVFGDAILHGKGRLALLGLSALVAVALGVHLLRRHYGKKRA
jgi:uncharacterized membrane protein YdjX (TVP38/TMEM64 family)